MRTRRDHPGGQYQLCLYHRQRLEHKNQIEQAIARGSIYVYYARPPFTWLRPTCVAGVIRSDGIRVLGFLRAMAAREDGS